MMIAAAAIITTTPVADAQVIFGQPTSGTIRFVYNSWSVESGGADTTLTQLMTPVYGFLPVADNVDVSVYIANSTNTLETPEGEFDLNGLGDLRVQARHSFAEDRLLLAVGLNLPTGKKELSFDEEWAVLQGLSLNYLDFPMRRFGEGFGFSLLFGGATTVGDNLKLGGGISYQYIGTYAPYSEYLDYDPGDVVSFNARGALNTGEWAWGADLVYSLYTTDRLEALDIDIFKQSPSLNMSLRVDRDAEPVAYGGSMRWVVRGDHEFYDPTDGAELASLKLYGDEFMFAGYASWMFAEQWYATPHARIRLIGSNDIEFESADIFSIGADVRRMLSEDFSVTGGLSLHTGTATTSNALDTTAPGVDSDISGYQLTLGLSAAL